MTEGSPRLADRLEARFGDRNARLIEERGEVTLEIGADHWLEVARALRDERDLRFEQLLDVCGMDYLGWGTAEWDTTDISSGGFSRGVEGSGPGRFGWADRPAEGAAPARRFGVVVHLLSVFNNQRLRLRVYAPDDALPTVPSLVEIWPVANWFEREAFDLFGIVFEGHPDLRRLLTDYGFVGHPFRKDFPLIGNVEVRYDPEKGRVVYEPVSIEPRVLVPRTIRDDSRHLQGQSETAAAKAKQ
jgi:NADH-quinone oxidoreductase subunit C